MRTGLAKICLNQKGQVNRGTTVWGGERRGICCMGLHRKPKNRKLYARNRLGWTESSTTWEQRSIDITQAKLKPNLRALIIHTRTMPKLPKQL